MVLTGEYCDVQVRLYGYYFYRTQTIKFPDIHKGTLSIFEQKAKQSHCISINELKNQWGHQVPFKLETFQSGDLSSWKLIL